MSVLLTNIDKNTLNLSIIKESFNKLKNQYELKDEEEITEIFYLNEKISKEKWNFEVMALHIFKIDMDKGMEEVYTKV
jgi:hypothetical protein